MDYQRRTPSELPAITSEDVDVHRKKRPVQDLNPHIQRVRASSSAVELTGHGWNIRSMKLCQVVDPLGFEPRHSASKAEVLPLHQRSLWRIAEVPTPKPVRVPSVFKTVTDTCRFRDPWRTLEDSNLRPMGSHLFSKQRLHLAGLASKWWGMEESNLVPRGT